MRHILAPALLLVAAALPAQDVLDYTEVRTITRPRQSFGMLQATFLHAFPEKKEENRYMEREDFLGGSLLYMTDGFMEKGDSLTFFAGREGVYASTSTSAFDLKGVTTRFEGWYRPWSIYREGFYQGSDFIPTHRFEGQEYRVRVGLQFPFDARGILKAEVAGFWGRNSFDRSSQTPTPASIYPLPDDHQVMGGRFSIEGGTIQYDRTSNRPIGGAKVTVWVEREINDADDTYGTPGWQSELPEQIWRAGGRMLLYYPIGKGHTLQVSAMGRYFDEEDRVSIYDASKPIGNRVLDATVGWRWDLGQSLDIMPFVMGQYIQIADEFGLSEKEKYFFGGGLNLRWAFSESFAIFLDYSYLENQSREPVGIDRDTLGEHRAMAGLEFTF